MDGIYNFQSVCQSMSPNPETGSLGFRDFPKRRGGGIGGGSGPTGRPTTTVSGSAVEQQADEVASENFPVSGNPV